jgi:hypothetical protein
MQQLHTLRTHQSDLLAPTSKITLERRGEERRGEAHADRKDRCRCSVARVRWEVAMERWRRGREASRKKRAPHMMVAESELVRFPPMSHTNASSPCSADALSSVLAPSRVEALYTWWGIERTESSNVPNRRDWWWYACKTWS